MGMQVSGELMIHPWYVSWPSGYGFFWGCDAEENDRIEARA
jgi:hypothetical protein